MLKIQIGGKLMSKEVNEETNQGIENTLVQSSPILPHGTGFQIIKLANKAEFDKVTGIWTISASHVYTGEEVLELKDHFPGAPILPGVLALEAQAQTAFQILAKDTSLTNKVFVFTGIDKAKFTGRIKVGTELTHIREVCHDGRYGKAKCKTISGDVVYATSELSFAIIRTPAAKRAEREL